MISTLWSARLNIKIRQKPISKYKLDFFLDYIESRIGSDRTYTNIIQLDPKQMNKPPIFYGWNLY